MNIEICDETSTTAISVAAMLCTATIIIFAVWSYNQRVQAMFAAGYEETTLPGTQGTSYHKAK